jgi:hypothetical protein
VYQCELDVPAAQQLAALSRSARAALAAFVDAVVLVDPVQYQRRVDERSNPPAPLRTLHFGPHHEGLVSFLVHPPDDLDRRADRLRRVAHGSGCLMTHDLWRSLATLIGNGPRQRPRLV